MQKLSQYQLARPSITHCGLHDLDEKYLLLTPGEVIVLGGRPSMGKSHFALFLALEAARLNSKKVLFFSNESSLFELTQLVNSMDPSFLNSSSGELICDEFAFNFEAIIHSVNSFDRNDLALVVIDSFQPLYFLGSSSQEDRTNKIVASLKHLARNCHVPILLTSSVSRGIVVRDDKRPTCLDFRESYSVEQVADKIVFLHREELYTVDPQLKNKTEVIIAKNRFGLTGKLMVELIANKFVQV